MPRASEPASTMLQTNKHAHGGWPSSPHAGYSDPATGALALAWGAPSTHTGTLPSTRVPYRVLRVLAVTHRRPCPRRRRSSSRPIPRGDRRAPPRPWPPCRRSATPPARAVGVLRVPNRGTARTHGGYSEDSRGTASTHRVLRGLRGLTSVSDRAPPPGLFSRYAGYPPPPGFHIWKRAGSPLLAKFAFVIVYASMQPVRIASASVDCPPLILSQPPAWAYVSTARPERGCRRPSRG
jgi:hypothetical protein